MKNKECISSTNTTEKSMSSVSVFKPESVDVTQMNFSKVKQGLHLKNVYVNMGSNKIHIQIPRSRVPFGVSTWESQDPNQPDKKELSISLGKDTNKSSVQFFKELDKYVMNYAVEHSQEWFGKPMSQELIQEFYKQSLDQKNPQYPPNFRMKIQNDVMIYDTKKNVQSLDYLEKGDDVTLVAELSGIWISGKRFGITWRLKQMKVHKKMKLKSYAFVEDEEDEENVSVSSGD